MLHQHPPHLRDAAVPLHQVPQLPRADVIAAIKRRLHGSPGADLGDQRGPGRTRKRDAGDLVGAREAVRIAKHRGEARRIHRA